MQTSVVLVWPWYQGSDPFYILDRYSSSYIYKLVGYESGMNICILGCNVNMIQVLQSLAFIFWVYETIGIIFEVKSYNFANIGKQGGRHTKHNQHNQN